MVSILQVILVDEHSATINFGWVFFKIKISQTTSYFVDVYNTSIPQITTLVFFGQIWTKNFRHPSFTGNDSVKPFWGSYFTFHVCWSSKDNNDCNRPKIFIYKIWNVIIGLLDVSTKIGLCIKKKNNNNIGHLYYWYSPTA